MNILIACEESQTICNKLIAKHFNAYSCDIIPCSGNHPERHILGDAIKTIYDKKGTTETGKKIEVEKWDIIIAHPPCTYLTVTGNRWFNIEKYGDKAIKRIEERKKAIEFFMLIARADCEKIAIENPVGIMSTQWRKPDQIIQPYFFGEPYEKKTCLWLKNLPLLKATNMVEPLPRTKFASGKTMATWYAELFKLPAEERSRIRSKTFDGIAEAIVTQWIEER